VRVVQSRGSRGFQLAAATATSLSFPASQIFTNCENFPREFSIRNEYIFSLVQEEGDRLLLGLRVSKERVNFLVGDGRRLSFRSIRLADGQWHTLILAVSGRYATLTIDCGLPVDLVLDQPVLSSFSTRRSRFYVGSRRRWKDRFSGLLRQLVLLPGSDATPRLCPASKPRLAELSVPEVLMTAPVLSDQQPSVFMHGPQRLDYVEDYQDVLTTSETFDVEWVDGRFQLYQNISTKEARAWKHFTLDGQVFLVVANSREAGSELSIIYRWSVVRRRFLWYQSLTTHSALDWEFFTIHNHSFLALFEVNQTLATSGAYDWEFFSIGPYHFLAVANTFDGHTTAITSTIYVWVDSHFIPFQHISTDGATDWEMFQIGDRYFLAVANSQRVLRQGPSLYSLNSTIYELNRLTHTFIRFQDLLTHSAVDWEFFKVGDERFLVVANSHDGSAYALNSVIYRWQGYEGFVPVHSLPTFGCRDWEFFSADSSSYLVYSSATSRLSKVFRLKTY
ncbi:hypothetical protein CRUP_012972, partial [Coryphaenoides rupestris]